MYLRSVDNVRTLVDGKQYIERTGATNLYPTAFPFSRCSNGGVGSIASITFHGINPAVTTAADIWGQNIIRTLPTAGFTLGISSSSAADILTSGTGAWTVEVDILDTSYIPHTLTMNLNGQTKVSDTLYVGTCLRVNDIRVIAVGTGLSNAGTIYAYDASDTVTTGVPQTSTKIFHRVEIGDINGRGAFYTVPAGCRLQAMALRAGFNDTSTTARVAIINLYQFVLSGTQRIGSYLPIGGQITSSGGTMDDPLNYIIIEEKTDVTIRSSASGAAVVYVYADAILYYK